MSCGLGIDNTQMLLIEDSNLHYRTTSSRSVQQYLFRLLQRFKTLTFLSQIHTQIVVNGFTQKSFIIAKLLSFYIDSGHLHSARKVFKNLTTPPVALWNQMIKGYAQSQSPRMSITLFNQMGATDVEPDGITYSLLLSGCGRSRLLREGEQLHGRVLINGYYSSNAFVKTNLVNFYAMAGPNNGAVYARRVFDEMPVRERNVVSWNSMLAGYIRCRDLNEARKVFDEMPERNVVSWTTMISGYAQNGRSKQALILFNRMRRANVELDQVALVAALSACAELGDLRLGKWIHSYIENNLTAKSHSLLISLNNALIHMYGSCGAIKEAYDVFRMMPKRSRISWTAMITAFAKQGYAQDALYIFDLMQSLGPAKEAKPDAITFVGVLTACSYAGLVEEGCQFFRDVIQKWGIEPKIEHYGCMVDLLSRAGLLIEAYELIESMPMKPNDAIWGALIGGCRVHRNAELATRAAQNLVGGLDPDKAGGYLLLIGQVYAAAGRWEDFASVKRKMAKMGASKPAGRSYVQINGVVCDFVAGENAHKVAPLVYEMAGRISQQVEWVSCEMDTGEVFSVVDG